MGLGAKLPNHIPTCRSEFSVALTFVEIGHMGNFDSFDTFDSFIIQCPAIYLSRCSITPAMPEINQIIKRIKPFDCFDFLINWEVTHASNLNKGQ